MNTLVHIKELLIQFRKEINKHKDIQKRTEIESDFLACIERLIKIYPHWLYPLCDTNVSDDTIQNLMNRIKESVKNNYIPIFPSNNYCFTDIINQKIIETPALESCMNFDNSKLYYPPHQSNKEILEKELIDYLLGIIISLPIKKIHFTFVELDNEFRGNYFYENLSPKLYDLITDINDFKNFLNQTSKRIISFKQKYKCYPKYCLKNKLIPEAFEFIVWLDYPNGEGYKLLYGDNHNKEMRQQYDSLVKNGKDSGIYIININRRREYEKLSLNENLFKLHRYEDRPTRKMVGINELTDDNFSFEEQVIKYDNGSCVYHRRTEWDENSIESSIKNIGNKDFYVTNTFVKDLSADCKLLLKCKSIQENPKLLNAFIRYINTEVDKKKESTVIIQDTKNSVSNIYERNLDTISVPIGKSSNNEVNFTMDMVSHVHSFIIGQSGSGKSVFLHNIIGSAILKYAPEDLQLYLLDFKLGGVEFNRYKGIKHVKSLLVDNSDQQITLEILRELREGMVERGRQLRDCGVNNIVEYNKQNPNATMPQILVVVDECHEMFRVGSDIPRTVSNEISEIITKVAKEGRSQGVHLILATQTLSGTEISNEILNNVSDHYLLKCATSDSERMVERSSEITSQLSTGQIYYHHVDSQVQFQAYYTDKENAEKLINLAKKKAENHQSNGEFYFNGSQLFKLDTTIVEQGKKRAKYPIAYMGKNISINQNDLSITLRKDCSENILLFGLNDVKQVTRTTMNVFLSLILTTKCKGLDIQFKVFNCLSDEDSIYTEQLELLEEEGYCEIIEGRKDRGKFLKQLAENISNETVENTILLILGQERFRELKMDMEISQEQSKPSEDGAFGFGGFSFSNEGTSSASVKTFKQALELILDKGPELGVHTIMQLDKPSNFLFSDYISPKLVYQKFKHLIMLKSDESASAQLHLNDNIRLETLSKDLERLRAYYYSEESDTYTLFTPYMELSNDEIINLLKSE